jgi:hypothetical protein
LNLILIDLDLDKVAYIKIKDLSNY